MTAKAAKKKIGKLVIREDLCKECNFCIETCPKDCITLSTTISAKGYYPAIFIEDGGCNACALCALVCPEAAIEVYSE
jgi:2-oxoglutarate ferredoxin oxidoreductase subunit delta